jgi:hypothetical protein
MRLTCSANSRLRRFSVTSTRRRPVSGSKARWTLAVPPRRFSWSTSRAPPAGPPGRGGNDSRTSANICQGRSSSNFDEGYFERVEGYYGLAAYKKAMSKRKVWIEPMFAEAKQWDGMERVRLRTLERVNAEVLVTATGQNVKRLLSSWGREPRKLVQAATLRHPGGSCRRPVYHRSAARQSVF